jgi:predicted GNAT family N-acyltransferase
MDSTSHVSLQKQVTIAIVATDVEKHAALSVRSKVFVHEQGVPQELEQDGYDDLQTTIHFLAHIAGTPIGAARLRPYSPGIGKVERVAVMKTVRNMGIGAILMHILEQEARQRGFEQLKLNAQIQAESFYNKIGYNPVGDKFFDAGIEHVSMVKNLSTK